LQAHVDEAELVQDTFQAAISAFAQFRGATEAELFVWLRQILRHRALNLGEHYLNTQKRAGRPVSLDRDFPESAWHDMFIDDEDTPCTSSGSREFKAIMQRALLQLKPHYQEVITLHYGAEKTFADIAALQNTTTDAVIKTWKRALKAWRRTMEEMGLKEW
jgi:RNA polymerase sigma factor (sigma-70 family)